MENKIKVLILVNTLQNVASYVYGNHIAFFVWTAKNRPDIEIIFYTPQRMSIDMARTMAAKQALQDECDYLMFLDDDVLVPADCLDKLLKAKKDIIAGLVIIRGYPFNVMAFKFDDKKNLTYYNNLEEEYNLPITEEWVDKETYKKAILLDDASIDKYSTKRLKELQDVDAVGFSCCLINTEIYKEMEPPYFVTGPMNTEDVYFCTRVQKEMRDENGNSPSIVLHTGVQCGHMMPAEAVEWSVRKKMQDYYAEAAELLKARIPVRDATYLDRSLNALGYKGEVELQP